MILLCPSVATTIGKGFFMIFHSCQKPGSADQRRYVATGVFYAVFAMVLNLCSICSPPSAAAAPPVIARPGIEHYSLDLNIDVLEDPAAVLTFAQIRNSAGFRPCTTIKPNWGFSSSVFWLRFTIGNRFDLNKEWLLEFEYPLLNEIEVFIPDGRGGFIRKLTGTAIPFADREIKNRNLLLSLPHSVLTGGTIYARIRSESTISLPMSLWSARAFIKADHNEQFVLGGYYGIILVMIIYSLLLLVTLRDASYFYHLVFIVNFGVFQMMMNGSAYEYLWPGQVWWNSHTLPMFITFAVVGACLFTRRFLDTGCRFPLIDRGLKATAVTAAAASLLPFLVAYSSAIKVASGLALVCITLILAAGGIRLWRGCRKARYFMAAWSLFCVGIILLVFRAFGALNNEAVYFWLPQVGSALTVILLALALAHRINLVQEENIEVQSRYRSIFENATEGIFRFAPDGRVMMVNPALATMFGYRSPEELMSASPAIDFTRVYVNPRHREELRQHLFDAGVVRNFTTSMYCRDRSIIHVMLNVTAIRDCRGQVIYLEGIVTDISERRKREEIEMSREAAMMASQAKSRFLAAMSHEIRTPMNGVIGFTDMLLKKEDDPERRRYLDLIRVSGDRLLKLIDEILDFSRIEAGKFTMETVSFSLTESLGVPLEILRHKAEEKGISFNWYIPDDLPPRLLGDSTRLAQVVINLVDNGIKFTRAGEVGLAVVEDHRDHDRVTLHFMVSDNGIGIAPEQAEKIFEPFTQGDDSTSRSYGGSGLGLAIAAELVEMMEGRIWVEDKSRRQEGGQGSLFHFTARFMIDQHPAATSAPRLPDPLPVPLAREIKVLIVDDEEINRILVAEILRQHGVTAVEAENGAAAIEMIAAENPDLVLMDVEMPDMDGIRTTGKIRAGETGGRRRPIIAMTAHAVAGYADQCRAVGMDDYISKPFAPDELLRKVLFYGSRDM